MICSSGNVEQPSVSFQDEALTDAENRVGLAVSRGLSNKEIAAELEISVRTVENHISHILEKKVLAIAWKSHATPSSSHNLARLGDFTHNRTPECNSVKRFG
jgi:DNA-binding CsgD family transcriptional regulator